jgi:hypothetical protein
LDGVHDEASVASLSFAVDIFGVAMTSLELLLQLAYHYPNAYARQRALEATARAADPASRLRELTTTLFGGLRRDVAAQLAALLEQCLLADPRLRPSAAAVRDALRGAEAVLQQLPHAAPPPQLLHSDISLSTVHLGIVTALPGSRTNGPMSPAKLSPVVPIRMPSPLSSQDPQGQTQTLQGMPGQQSTGGE